MTVRGFFASFIVFICSFSLHAQQPLPQAEMRGVWIATVLNIDWPSAPGLPPATRPGAPPRSGPAQPPADVDMSVLDSLLGGDAKDGGSGGTKR